MSHAVLYCTPSYKHWYPKLQHTRWQATPARTRRHNKGYDVMATCYAGLNKAPVHTAAAYQPRRTNTTKINQAIHKVNTQVLRQIKAHQRQKHFTTASSQPLNTNTTASSELLTTTAAIKNEISHVKCCTVLYTILQALVSQVATHALASNTSQNKTTQQRLRRHGHLLCWVE